MEFIGCKYIKAEPLIKGDAEGYKVIYPDGYESWCPKDVFENAYIPLTGDRCSIEEDMVNDFISKVESRTVESPNGLIKTTIVLAYLKNGFSITESSACVDIENYSKELGTEICLRKIKDKVWFLLGFLLQTARYG